MKNINVIAIARAFLASGPQYVPESFGNGTGAAGEYVQSIFGVDRNNRDTPDHEHAECKWDSGRFSDMNMSQKEPEEPGAARYITEQYGYPGRNGCTNFRRTFNVMKGLEADGFSLRSDRKGTTTIHHVDEPLALATWTRNTVLNFVAGKFRRLIRFDGTYFPSTRMLTPLAGTYFQELNFDVLCSAIATGLISVEVNAAYQPDNRFKNHGCRFRIKHADVARLYLNAETI